MQESPGATPGAGHRHAARATPASQAARRFDPPAAGPTAVDAAYEACIDLPSPDGLAIDCQSLRVTATPKPRPKR